MLARTLPGRTDVAVVERFLTRSEHDTLITWANDQFRTGQLHPNDAGPGRFFMRYPDGDPRVPAIYPGIRARAVETFGVEHYEEEPQFKCFLGCNTRGAFVHQHQDEEPDGAYHLRFNIMLSKPYDGGVPVVGGREIQVGERDLWCFHPAAMLHGSTPVAGPRRRFVLSIGILVPAG